MNFYQKILATGALIASIGLSGCVESGCVERQTLEGTVKEEFGTAPRIVESSGAIFGNESVKVGDLIYGLVLETNMGEEYTFSVIDSERKPVYALAKAIEPGDRVRIIWTTMAGYVDKDHIGKVRSTDVDLIEKAKK